MDYLEYKGYKGSVEYSKEDDCLVGKVLGLTKETILYEGSTLEELKADFEAGIDSYLAYCESEGIKPSKGYSGAFQCTRFSGNAPAYSNECSKIWLVA